MAKLWETEYISVSTGEPVDTSGTDWYIAGEDPDYCEPWAYGYEKASPEEVDDYHRRRDMREVDFAHWLEKDA